MMEILMYPVLVLYIFLGAGSSIVIVGYLFIVLAQKIRNKLKTGASLYS